MKFNLRHGDICFGFLIMRLAVGLTFFMAGLNKLFNYSGTVQNFIERFSTTWLAGAPVSIFAQALPFVEVGLGGLVILGLFTRGALYLLGLLMLTLIFGLQVERSAQAVQNIPYLLLIGLDIILLSYNKYSLDGLFFGRHSKS